MSSKYQNNQPIIIAVIAFFLNTMISACNFIVPRHSKPYTVGIAVDLPSNIDIVDGELRSIQNKDTVLVAFVDDVCVYRFTPSHEMKIESDGTMVETGFLIPNSSSFFCFRPGEQKGLYLPRPSDRAKPVFLNVDSTLMASGFKGMTLELAIDKIAKEMLTRTETPVGYEEKIANTIKKGETDFDTLYLTFSRELDTRGLTLSKQLDSASGMRLIKWTMFFNEYFSSSQNRLIPKRHLSVQFIADPPIDAKRLDSVLAVYRAMKQ